MDDAAKSDCFQTDHIRVFTDFINVKSTVYMVVKTWQKVIFQTPNQRSVTGNAAEMA